MTIRPADHGIVASAGGAAILDYSTTGSPTATDYTDSGTKYRSLYWTGSGTFVVNANSGQVAINVLVGAGGGGGGPGASGGGGGGGGCREGTIAGSTAAQTWTFVAGAGGAGAPDTAPRTHTDGVNSTFTGGTSGLLLSCTGGGRGGTWNSSNSGGDGGGGGGGSGWYASTKGAGNAGGYSPVEGYEGADGVYGVGFYYDSGGGGGGSGAVGTISTPPYAPGGPGGNAMSSSYRTGSSENAFGGGAGAGGYNQNYPQGSTGSSLGYGNGGLGARAGGFASNAGTAGACVVRFPYEW